MSSPSADATPTSSLVVPRLVARDLPFSQSSNRLRLQLLYQEPATRRGIRSLLIKHDWFHALLRFPFYQTLGALIAIWTLFVVLFGVLYRIEDVYAGAGTPCGLGVPPEPIEYYGAFAFSLQTWTQVGYTTPNGSDGVFRPDCGPLLTIIYLQILCSLLYNAFLISFMYSRLASPRSRAHQVVFSKQALISCAAAPLHQAMESIKASKSFSPWYLVVRMYDTDARYPVVEANVQMYVIRRTRPAVWTMVPQPLRLIRPTDETNAWFHLSLPTTACHHVDLYSALHPPSKNTGARVLGPGVRSSSALVLRQADSATGMREEVSCPICAEVFGTMEQLLDHVSYQQIVEKGLKKTNEPTLKKEDEWCHLQVDLHRSVAEHELVSSIPSAEELLSYLRENISEILVVVEGIDPLTSGTFQAIHSYQVEDLVVDADACFVPCVSVQEKTKSSKTPGQLFVDLDRFHDILK